MSARKIPDREIRLRRRLDFAISERDAANKEVARLVKLVTKVVSRCSYCGVPTRNLACAAHSDLIALDPFYAARARRAA